MVNREYEELQLLRNRFSAAENTTGSFGSRLTALEGGAPNNNTPGLVNYTIDETGDFNNPGRGMEESYESAPGTLHLEGDGLTDYPHSTFRRYWWIPAQFHDEPLSQAMLDGLEDDIDHWVSLGKLANARVAYVGAGDPQPAKSVIDNHINQMLPILSAKAYAFRTLEMGWFGPWGEFHGITSPGWTDISPSNQPQPQTLAMFQHIANNTPSSLYIALRCPEVAMWLEDNGLSAAHKARMGIYNDDFLSSAGGDANSPAIEGGTFPGAWADGLDIPRREWLHQIGLTRPVRGESGVDNDPSGDGNWALSGDNAMYYGFQRQHIDCLREWGLIPIVLDPKGITARVKREMGYRLQLKQGRFPLTVPDNTALVFDLEIENIGVAPPRREYVAKVKFGTSANTAATAWVTATMNAVNVDGNNVPTTTGAALTTKQWLGWQSTSQPTTTRWVRFTCTVPSGLSGNYPLSLALIDPNTQLQGNVAFNIRLANNGTWDGTNGRNNLLHNLTVT